MNKKKFCLLGGIAVICALLTIYLAFSLFFIRHYYFGTMIGNLACGGMTAEEAASLIEERAQNYTLKIQGREGTEAVLTASDIDVRFLPDDTLTRIVEEQKGTGWVSFLWKDESYEMPVTVSYDEELLNDRLQDMFLFQTDKMRKPVDAYVGEFDEESGTYQIIAEDKGTWIDGDSARAAVIRSIERMEEELDLEEAGCYREPEICKEDEEINRFCSRLNRFTSSRIVYDWHGIEEIVDGSLIQGWLDIDRENMTVSIDSQAVREYVNSLSKKNDTFGKIRTFRTSEGKEIQLEPGSYGWRVNRSKETEKLIKLIRAGWSGSREPEYLYTAAVKGEDDIGDSYVEIDLTRQHLYLYVEGELVIESDFVSGNVSRGFDTPAGVYGLTYKTLNATLKGQGYATPVDYWMPFNVNVGMHDASWRRQFGGNIYLKNGSHGCINLPAEAAKTIYGYVYKGFPVICYKDGSAQKAAENPEDAVNDRTEEQNGTQQGEADQTAGTQTGEGTQAGIQGDAETAPAEGALGDAETTPAEDIQGEAGADSANAAQNEPDNAGNTDVSDGSE